MYILAKINIQQEVGWKVLKSYTSCPDLKKQIQIKYNSIYSVAPPIHSSVFTNCLCKCTKMSNTSVFAYLLAV